MVRSFFYILLVGANSIRALKLGPIQGKIQGKIKVLRDTRVRTESVDASLIYSLLTKYTGYVFTGPLGSWMCSKMFKIIKKPKLAC